MNLLCMLKRLILIKIKRNLMKKKIFLESMTSRNLIGTQEITLQWVYLMKKTEILRSISKDSRPIRDIR